MFGLRRNTAVALGCFVLVLFLGFGIFLTSAPGAGQRAQVEATAFTAELIEGLIAFAEEEPFARPTGPWQLSLPQDHGGHPEARAETWMIAAHLTDENGVPIGMTFSLSRFGLRADPPDPDGSPWDLRALYRAHVTLARGDAPRAQGEERFSRGAGAAGHNDQAREIWLDDWQLSYGEEPGGKGLTLTASVHETPFRLVFEAVKDAEPAGDDEAAPLRGFAIPRLTVTGHVGVGEAATSVTGVAWLDRFWGELPTPGGPLAYERLILQLDDGTDVSLLRSGRRDGRGSTTVDGLVISPKGDRATLTEDALWMIATEHRTSPGGGTIYPVAWRVEGAGLDLDIAPLTEDKVQAFVLPGWNGVVTVSGRRDGARITGLGTLQLTGYDAR